MTMLAPLSRKPLVSVVMPSYNYGMYVMEAVRSVFEQTYRSVELIAVDDGSTDDTVAILRRLSAESPFRMEIVEADHGGVCAAMNAGLKQSRGELISVLHADDVYEPTKIAAQVEAFRADPELVLVHSEYQVIDEAGARLDVSSELDRPPARGLALRDILAGSRHDVRSMTMMYRADVMKGIGGYDEALPSEDWQSILRLAHAGPIGHVDERLVLRRVHRRSYSVKLYRGSSFSTSEIAVDVLREVTPPDMKLDAICGEAVGIVVRNSLAEGNLKKALTGIRTGWQEFPGGRAALARMLPSGLRSFIWMRYVQRMLPDAAVARIRSIKKRSG